jgi:hypothetical protein
MLTGGITVACGVGRAPAQSGATILSRAGRSSRKDEAILVSIPFEFLDLERYAS